MPTKLALSGKASKKFFDRHGHLRHIHELRYWGPASVLQEKYELNPIDAAVIESFLLPMMHLDPTKRATAYDAAKHPWLAVTEDGSFIDFRAQPDVTAALLDDIANSPSYPPPFPAASRRNDSYSDGHEDEEDALATMDDSGLIDEGEVYTNDAEEGRQNAAGGVQRLQHIIAELRALPPNEAQEYLAELGLQDVLDTENMEQLISALAQTQMGSPPRDIGLPSSGSHGSPSEQHFRSDAGLQLQDASQLRAFLQALQSMSPEEAEAYLKTSGLEALLDPEYVEQLLQTLEQDDPDASQDFDDSRDVDTDEYLRRGAAVDAGDASPEAFMHQYAKYQAKAREFGNPTHPRVGAGIVDDLDHHGVDTEMKTGSLIQRMRAGVQSRLGHYSDDSGHHDTSGDDNGHGPAIRSRQLGSAGWAKGHHSTDAADYILRTRNAAKNATYERIDLENLDAGDQSFDTSAEDAGVRVAPVSSDLDTSQPSMSTSGPSDDAETGYGVVSDQDEAGQASAEAGGDAAAGGAGVLGSMLNKFGGWFST
jgi:hypothetical protein